MTLQASGLIALTVKDIRLNAKPWAYYALTSALYPIVLVSVLVQVGRHANPGQLHPPALVPVSFIVVLFFPHLCSQWLIGTEKTKRTLLLLRILPIPQWQVMLAKLIACLALTLSIVAVNGAATTAALLYAPQFNTLRLTPALVIATLIVLVTESTVSLYLQLRYDSRLAFQIPFAIILAGRPALSVLYESQGRSAELVRVYGGWFILAALLSASVLCFARATTVLQNTDWAQHTSE